MKRWMSVFLILALCLTLLPKNAQAATTVETMKITDYMGNVITDPNQPIEIQVGTKVMFSADYFDDKGSKLIYPVPMVCQWSLGSASESVEIENGYSVSDKWIVGKTATSSAVTITVTSTYQQVDYTASFQVKVVEKDIADGIAYKVGAAGTDYPSAPTLTISPSYLIVYAYPTIHNQMYPTTFRFVQVDWQFSNEGISTKEVYNSPFGIQIASGICQEGDISTVLVTAAGLTDTITLEYPWPEYKCGLIVYPPSGKTVEDLVEVLEKDNITSYTRSANYVVFSDQVVGSGERIEKYYEQFRSSSSTKYSATAFTKTINELFFNDEPYISEGIIDTYYFNWMSDEHNFVLSLKAMPGDEPQVSTNYATLTLVNYDGETLAPTADGGFVIEDSNITTISDRYYGNSRVNIYTDYPGSDSSDPEKVLSWQYAEIKEENGQKVVYPLSTEVIQSPFLIPESGITLLARYDEVKHFVRIVELDYGQQNTDLVGNPYEEITNGDYTPATFIETAEDTQGNPLDFTYEVSEDEYKELYGGASGISEPSLISFMAKKGIAGGYETIESITPTQYEEIQVSKAIPIEENQSIDPNTSLVILTCVVSFKETFVVTVQTGEGGTASASPVHAYEGQTVTLSATPNSGYYFTGWQVISGNVSLQGNTFIMPGEPVTVKANFARYSVQSGNIMVEETEHGSILVTPSRATSGTIITLEVIPDPGYELETLYVLNQRGDEIKLTDQGEGKKTFVMPQGNVTIKATFKPIECDGGEDCPSYHLTDVKVGAWYHYAVDYVVEHGIMEGTSATTFEPYGTLSRAMVVQVLYNLEGRPPVTGTSNFTDVKAYDWWNDAVIWATEIGVVQGYGDGTFLPKNPVTREEFALMMYHYAEYKGYDLSAKGDLSSYPDSDKVSTWAEEAMQWANGNELITGFEDGTIRSKASTNRAQAATMWMRFDYTVAE